MHAVFSVYLVFPNRIIDQRIRPSERRTVVENPGSEVRCSRGNLRGHEVVIELLKRSLRLAQTLFCGASCMTIYILNDLKEHTLGVGSAS